jgi:hypothetical protein
MASGELLLSKVDLDDAQHFEVGLHILVGVKLENLCHNGEARPDGGNRVVCGGGGLCAGMENDLVTTNPEEEWYSLCAKEECSNNPKKLRPGATDAGTQGNSPQQMGKGPNL